MKQDKDLINLCYRLWEGMHPFRESRATALDFAYGRHWQRPFTLPDGRITTQEREMRARGKQPITNNLTRQLIKTVVGKWRYLRSRHTCPDEEGEHTLGQALVAGTLRDLSDARALEEFLISGMTAQLVDRATGRVDNISPARLLFGTFLCEDASDCRLMGVLHDLPSAEIMRRFGESGSPRYGKLAAIIHKSVAPVDVPFGMADVLTFDTPLRGGCVRAIEIWRRTAEGILRLHDPETGAYVVAPADSALCRRLTLLNRRRRCEGRPEIAGVPDVVEGWEHVWLLTDGTVLRRGMLAEGERPPLVVRCYPMIDGEVHSLVHDVIPQQEYVNRLVQLLDDTLEHAAKGVLLYPTDQLPHGMTWDDLRRIWSTPGSIVPFMRNSRNITPTQVTAPGTSVGASEMLRTQLDLFGRISGTTFATEGHGMEATGADMLRRRMENEMVALLDILASFEAFVAERDFVAGKGVGHA